MTTPAIEYADRLRLREAALAALQLRDARLSYLRLAVFAAAVLVAWLAFWHQAIPWGWLVPLGLAFVWLMELHDRVIRARQAAARAVVFYGRGLGRIEDRWIGTGEPGDRFRLDEHLYANDLDLFGRGSLFELLSIARTRAGEETLAAWLLAPTTAEVVRRRQQAIEELTPRLDLREELFLAGSEVRASVDTEALIAWAAAPRTLRHRWVWAVAAGLSMAAVASAISWILGGSPGPFFAVVALEVLFSLPRRARTQAVLHAADRPARELDVLAHLLARIERVEFQTDRLVELRRAVGTGGLPASVAIGRLHRLSALHDWQHNQFFAPLAALLLWGTHLSFAIEAWRSRHGADVEAWLATTGEFEALSSLSAYRYEHLKDVFPEILENGSTRFEAEALGHPLIPESRLVRNDVRLGDAALLVVSGSNMSGKSTLLRTVGIAAVLALAGAPVRAARLRLTPVAVGATLRIQDSLQEGRSRFYAEITRLRRLVDVAAGPLPLLFLLDELFHGTNSQDRLVGATGVLRNLLDRGAIGLITTHDLALTAVADDLAPRAANVHFEDTFEGGEIRFDYRLRPGPVSRSNALALMRAVGLEVPGES